MSLSDSQPEPQIRPPRGETRDGYVFISYKREEAVQAKQIRNALLAFGFEVWWDEDIQCGQAWSAVLDEAIRGAGCVVVLWSDNAKTSRWVMHEASRAIDRAAYVPVRITLCTIDAPFDRLQATDIIGWDGASEHPGVNALLAAVNRLLPAKKGRIRRAKDWLLLHVAQVLSIAFGVAALCILSWQIVVTRMQLRALSDLTAQQRGIGERSDKALSDAVAKLEAIDFVVGDIASGVSGSKPRIGYIGSPSRSSPPGFEPAIPEFTGPWYSDPSCPWFKYDIHDTQSKMPLTVRAGEKIKYTITYRPLDKFPTKPRTFGHYCSQYLQFQRGETNPYFAPVALLGIGNRYYKISPGEKEIDVRAQMDHKEGDREMNVVIVLPGEGIVFSGEEKEVDLFIRVTR